MDVKDNVSTELGSSHNATMEAGLGRKYQSNQVLERAAWTGGGVPRTQHFFGADSIESTNLRCTLADTRQRKPINHAATSGELCWSRSEDEKADKEGPPAECTQRVSSGLAVRCGYPWRKTYALHDRRLRSRTRSFALSCAFKGSGQHRGHRRRDGETPSHCRRDSSAVSIAITAACWSAISSTMTFSPLPSWSRKGPWSMLCP